MFILQINRVTLKKTVKHNVNYISYTGTPIKTRFYEKSDTD